MAPDHGVGVVIRIIIDNEDLPVAAPGYVETPQLIQGIVQQAGSVEGADDDRGIHLVWVSSRDFYVVTWKDVLYAMDRHVQVAKPIEHLQRGAPC